MESKIARALKMHYQPVAVIFSNTAPLDAFSPEGKNHSCIIQWFWQAVEGKTILFNRENIPCGGGRGGLCFGDEFAANPDRLAYFLSTGIPGKMEGEGYKKTPDLARASWKKLTKVEIKQKNVIFRPLGDLTPADSIPKAVIFPANPDQLAALVVLANYARPSNDNVIVPFGSGCSTIVRYPYLEGRKKTARAVIGFTDVTGRSLHPADVLTFSVPWKMYEEMESNVEGSFLGKIVWGKLYKRI